MKRGFTLVELLVVVGIIGLLTSVILANLQGAKAGARDSRRMSDIQQITRAMELYKTDSNGRLPSGVNNGDCKQIYAFTEVRNAILQYMPTLPQDPVWAGTNLDYIFRADDVSAGKYTLAAELEISDEDVFPVAGCIALPPDNLDFKISQ